MKKIGTLLIGVILGIFLTFVLIFKAAPSMMMVEDESKYNFEETVQKFQEAVAEQGWSISKIHDLQATMAKHNYDVEAVKVIELCHPTHASKILLSTDERIVTSLMPCRVSIYEKNGKVIVSRMNTGMMAKTFGGLVAEVMDQASQESEIMINTVIVK